MTVHKNKIINNVFHVEIKEDDDPYSTITYHLENHDRPCTFKADKDISLRALYNHIIYMGHPNTKD